MKIIFYIGRGIALPGMAIGFNPADIKNKLKKTGYKYKNFII